MARNLPFGPQRSDRGGAQTEGELARVWGDIADLRLVGPELGAETVAGNGGSLGRPSSGYMALALLRGYSRPFRTRHLALRLGASAGTVTWVAALYRMERRLVRSGYLKALLAASASGSTSDTGSARQCVELDREVLINTDDLWFAGVRIGTNGLFEYLDATDRYPAWTAYQADDTPPPVVSWQTGDSAQAALGEALKTNYVPVIQALSLTGKRLLWD